MNTQSKIAFWCYLVAMVPQAAWGVMFLFRTEFMPYHAQAVGMPWSAIPGPLQILVLGFLKLVGAAWLSSALGVLILLPAYSASEKLSWLIVSNPLPRFNVSRHDRWSCSDIP